MNGLANESFFSGLTIIVDTRCFIKFCLTEKKDIASFMCGNSVPEYNLQGGQVTFQSVEWLVSFRNHTNKQSKLEKGHSYFSNQQNNEMVNTIIVVKRSVDSQKPNGTERQHAFE